VRRIGLRIGAAEEMIVRRIQNRGQVAVRIGFVAVECAEFIEQCAPDDQDVFQ
jgi:hypothetical protein